MTVLEWQARQIEMAGNTLAHFVSTTDPTKLDWKPKAEGEESKSRSIFEYVGECVSVNNMTAAMLRGEEPPPRVPVEVSDCETACALLKESAKNFAEAVKACDDSIFEKKFQLPFGEWPGSMLLSVPMMNMQYHAGQVNYVQNLYGDDEFHIPPVVV